METILKPFEALTVQELYDMLRLRCDVFVVEQTCPYPELDGKDKLAHHLLLKDEGRIIGGLRILPLDLSYPGHLSLGRIVLHPHYRGRSLAGPMVKAGIRAAQALYGATPIKIGAQTRLLGFYQSLGFVAASESYLEDDIPHTDMVWQG